MKGIERRKEAIDEELATSGSGFSRVAELARERAGSDPIVTACRQYCQLQDQGQQACQVMQNGDVDLAGDGPVYFWLADFTLAVDCP